MSVLEKATQLIDCLGQAGEPVTLAYLREQLRMPKSSTHRLLAELSGLGIVRRSSDSRYTLGPRLLYWGEAAADTFDLRAIAEDGMRRLRDELEESVHLYVREGDVRICIAAVEGHHELRPFIALGRPLPLRTGAAGKLLLAFADEGVRHAVLADPGSDPGSAPQARSLVDELPRIADEHWTTSIGERQHGVAAAATSIRDSHDRVVAALGVSGPTARLTPERLEAMRSPLERAAAEISTRLQRG